jgi:hypothetical protein
VCSETGVLVCHTCLWTLRDFYLTGFTQCAPADISTSPAVTATAPIRSGVQRAKCPASSLVVSRDLPSVPRPDLPNRRQVRTHRSRLRRQSNRFTFERARRPVPYATVSKGVTLVNPGQNKERCGDFPWRPQTYCFMQEYPGGVRKSKPEA